MMCILHSDVTTTFGAGLCEILYAGRIKTIICWQSGFSRILWGKEYESGWDSYTN